MAVRRGSVLLLLIWIAALLVRPVDTVQAATTINVNTTNPNVNDGDGLCSLIEALDNFNFGAPTHPDCPAGDQSNTTINLTVGTYALTKAYQGAGTIGAVATPPIGQNTVGNTPINLTINGNGATITRDANAPDFRLLYVIKPAVVTINDLIIRGAKLPTAGNTGADGAVYNDNATLTINRSTLTDNGGPSAGGGTGGGAITSRANGSNTATLTINDSVLSNNSSVSTTAAFGSGGGVNAIAIDTATVRTTITNTRIQNNVVTNQGGGVATGAYITAGARSEMTIERSSITGNRATGIPGVTDSFGGGVINFTNVTGATANITIRNTTIAENRAENNGYGGGLFHETGCVSTPDCGTANATLENVTLYNNVGGQEPGSPASRGGGIWTNNQANPAGGPGGTMTTTLKNTIIFGNNFRDCRDAARSIIRQGFNIDSDGTCGANTFGAGQLNLGPAASGPDVPQTIYYPLQTGSVAIDRATDCGVAVDQLNRSRPRGAACDVGAYESDASGGPAPGPTATFTPTPVSGPTATPTPTPIVCSPRPPVRLSTTQAGPEVLQVTVTAGGGALQTITFADVNQRPGTATNVQQITIAGNAFPVGSTYNPPAGTSAVTFTIQRSTPGVAMQVPFTVVDGCGTWRTFVGMGTATP